MRGEFALGPLTLAGYSSQDVSLASVMSQLPASVAYGSIRIQYSGAPGSMVAEVASVEQRQDLVVDSKLVNEGNRWAESGVNPWHLDAETESILFLTNMSDRAARIGFNMRANGTVYYLTKLQLTPHETRAIDLRKLRDAQQADFKGNKIPAGATEGSVHWIRLDNLPVTGRLVVITRHGGLASNFDCSGGCSCPANDTALTVTPATAYMLPGGTAQMTATETATDCNSQNYYYDETGSSSWSSSNTSVATINSTGLVTALAEGSAGMTASLGACTYNPYYNCNCQPFTLHGAASCDVQKAHYVGVGSPMTGSSFCSGTNFSARYLIITYEVLDSSKSPINKAGMSAAEQLSWTSGVCTTSNACGQQPSPATWSTDSAGKFTDEIQNCSSTCTHGGSCTEDWQQTFTVNGVSVGIVNGSVTGTLNCITTSCNTTPQGITH